MPVRGDGRFPVSLTDCHFHLVKVVSCSKEKQMDHESTVLNSINAKFLLLSGTKTNASVWMTPLSTSFLTLFLL